MLSLGFPALGLTPPVTDALQAGGNDGVCFGAEFAFGVDRPPRPS